MLGQVKSGSLPRGALDSRRICRKRLGHQEHIAGNQEGEVLGEILILASEEPDGYASGKKDEKPKEGGGGPGPLADGMCMNRLREVCSRSLLVYCILVLILENDFLTGAVLATALAKLLLRFNELMSDSTASNTLHAEVCLSFCGVLAIWAILTTIYILGNVDCNLHYPHRTIPARQYTDRR
jgi:coatomer subunit beta